MQAVNKNQLFLASRIALIVTAITFAYRAALEGTWGTEFNLTKEQIGWIFSPAFWGFTLAMIFGGPLCDVLGMKKLVGLAFIGHVAGIIIYLVAKDATMLIYRNCLYWYWQWNGGSSLQSFSCFSLS